MTINDYTKIRKTTYEKLCQAQNNLPGGWKFRVYEGLRSLKVQKILFDTLYNSLKLKNNALSEEELFEKTSLLIAPIKFFNGTTNVPPHSTGGAVDLEVVDNDRALVNFGMEIKDWSRVTPDICNTVSQNISEEAKKIGKSY